MSQNKIVKIFDYLVSNQELNGLFRLNSMTKDIEFLKPAPWGAIGNLTDNDLIQLKYYLARIYDKEFNKQAIEEAVIVEASQRKYNPLVEYLKSVKWDGVERIDQWLIHICGTKDNIYMRDVGKIILCAAARRAFEPGCKFDYMPILEGPQGARKSTLVDILGGNWYLDTHLSTSENKKDIVDAMRTAWIIEISDLAGFRKNDVEYLKNFLSDRSDRVRMPYARRSEDYPRQCIFIGTHNPSGDNDYFKDDTGNRRFWPIECGKINIDLLIQDRDQLFAEAVIKQKNEFLYLRNEESLKILDELHKDRQVETPLNRMIDDYIKNLDMISNIEIIEKIFTLIVGKLTYSELRSKCTVIGIHMRKIGWVKGKNEKTGWYFRPGNEYREVKPVRIEQMDWEE